MLFINGSCKNHVKASIGTALTSLVDSYGHAFIDGQLIPHSTMKKINSNIVLGKKATKMVSFFAYKPHLDALR
ncbi:hypothetical protein [Lederbergia citrea]|uniref:hypothetical protein n=1 Tax=Lederbergia citrea TaxID=2833581 RepID=UPI001BCA5A2F|nr:hypothetical protein [Lederbergia citrea]MBS4204334.1 hypothetical protein [Lederbergia citrea]